jgi:sugar lactone lactonase YvrE
MGVYGTNRVSKYLQSRCRTIQSALIKSMIVIFDPTGKHLKDIKFSGKNLTCPTWGGKNLDILFVTSAKDPFLGIKDGDEGGNMFKYMIREGPKGKPKFEFAG